MLCEGENKRVILRYILPLAEGETRAREGERGGQFGDLLCKAAPDLRAPLGVVRGPTDRIGIDN